MAYHHLIVEHWLMAEVDLWDLRHQTCQHGDAQVWLRAPKPCLSVNHPLIYIYNEKHKHHLDDGISPLHGQILVDHLIRGKKPAYGPAPTILWGAAYMLQVSNTPLYTNKMIDEQYTTNRVCHTTTWYGQTVAWCWKFESAGNWDFGQSEAQETSQHVVHKYDWGHQNHSVSVHPPPIRI